MENSEFRYSPAQALADADAASVDAARLLRQPVRFHVARGVLAAAALAIFAVSSLWVMVALVVVVIVAMTLVDRLTARAMGVQGDSADVRRFWPANQRTVLAAALVCILAMALAHAARWAWPVRLLPCVAYGVVWTVVGIQGDRERMRDARVARR